MDGTRIRIINTKIGDQGTVVSLEASQYYDLTGPSDAELYIFSNKPVQIAQLCMSSGADGNKHSDPFMSLVVPVSQYTNHYTFSTVLSFVEQRPYANFIALTLTKDYTSGLLLNGAPIPG